MDLPHVSGDSQLITIKKLDILAEKISSPVPVFHLPPSLRSNVSDEVDRLTLSLSTPHLPGINLSQTIVVFYLRKRYLFYGYFFVEALGKEFFDFLNFVLRNLGNILHQKYRVSGQSLG